MSSQDRNKGIVPFFPNHLITEVAVAFGVFGIVLVLAGVMPRELGPPANTIMTPSHIQPEWYFLWLFGLLKVVPQLLGIIIPVVLIGALICLPWIDRRSSRRPAERAWVIFTAEITLIVMVVLTYIGLKF